LINYDLPWNPQRIEQRIGRCHRYGQKRDVTVINFLAKDNEAQRLTFEILSTKLDLFGKVLDSSDVVLQTPRSDASEALASSLGPEFEAEIRRIFAGFIGSSAYSEVAGSRILGREVPLVMPWNGQIMEGVIDLIYEKNGLLYLADYKTDRIAKAELSQGVERYRPQAEIYSKAVEQSLGRSPAAFKVIFLRLGKAVELVPQEPNQELWLF